MIGEHKCRLCLADVRGEKWMRDKRTPKDVCGEAIHNGDAATVLRSLLFVWVSPPRTTAKSSFSQNPWEESPWHSFDPVNPKQPWAALLWAHICLKIILCQTVVKRAFHSLHSDTKDNYGQHGRHKLVVWFHPKFTSQWHFWSMLFFCANYNSKCCG